MRAYTTRVPSQKASVSRRARIHGREGKGDDKVGVSGTLVSVALDFSATRTAIALAPFRTVQLIVASIAQCSGYGLRICVSSSLPQRKTKKRGACRAADEKKRSA